MASLRSFASRALIRAANVLADEQYRSRTGIVEAPFLPCSDEDVERWNKEWLHYLGREYATQLTPYTDYGEPAPLPDSPLAMIDHTLGTSNPFAIYAHREWIADRALLEVGCGCANLGKLVSRYAKSYLGTDYSTLALKVAKLVCPPNASFVHLSDRPGLAQHFGKIDTVLARYFFIHQNAPLAAQVLRFMTAFLRPGGRIYADFFWPDPAGAREVKRVLPATHELSVRYPSSVFAYERADVEAAIRGLELKIVEEAVNVRMQRRFVVFEKNSAR
jgi:SAM-dependent methyltransferase